MLLSSNAGSVEGPVIVERLEKRINEQSNSDPLCQAEAEVVVVVVVVEEGDGGGLLGGRWRGMELRHAQMRLTIK